MATDAMAPQNKTNRNRYTKSHGQKKRNIKIKTATSRGTMRTPLQQVEPGYEQSIAFIKKELKKAQPKFRQMENMHKN